MLKELGLTAVVALVVLVGAQFVFPIQFAYATSDSMAPVIGEDDAYFVVESDSIQQGDIITFYSPDQDEYVTHRVVGQVEAGYVTQGDANPTTDQAGGAPPVRDSAVIGKVVMLNGRPLTIPAIGPILALIDANQLLVIAGALIVFGADLAVSLRSSSGPATREVPRVGDVLHPLVVGTFILCVVLIAMSGSVHNLSFVATAEETGSPQTVTVGESAIRTMTVEAEPSPLTTYHIQADGVEVTERTWSGSSLELAVRVPPQDSVGPYEARLGIYQYPRTLPKGLLAWLHEIHWLAATVGSLIPVFGPLTAAYLWLFDTASPIRFHRRTRRRSPRWW